MVDAHQRIEITILFNDNFILTNNQIRYINENITKLVMDSINKGGCSSMQLKEGLDINDEVIVADNDYIFEFIANVKCDYSAGTNMINNSVNGSIVWNNVEKVEEINKYTLVSLIKKYLLIGDFGMHVKTVYVNIDDELFDLPPNSAI